MSIFGDDQLLKSVRITDAIKVEVYQQGKRRKYAIFYDSMNPKINNKRGNNDNTKSEKYDVSLTDDQVIEEALKSYNVRFSNGDNFYKIEQDPYKEIPKRVYGSAETPYYLNNGCKITIEWFGYIPNPYFTLGTSSTAKESEEFNKNKWIEGGYKGGYISRFIKNENITSDYDVSSLYRMAPFSTWVVPTGEINQSSLQMEPDYRDSTSVEKKQVTIYMPDGFTENYGTGYIIWAKNDELKYWDDTRDNDRFRSYTDESVLRTVIEKFKTNVTKLHGINDYDLKLCPIDTEYCKLIEYKSPIETPNNTPSQAAVNDTPPGPSQSTTKIKLNIQGLFDSGDGTTPGNTASVFEIKAKTDMPTFTIWTGEIPKTEEIDEFKDSPELDDEYTEGGYKGEEETGLTLEVWKVQDDISNGQQDSDSNNGTVGDPADIKPVSNFDQLINLAGKCARELGKNGRVNAENMKKGYTKGIHGLCPQGTQAVLYALTGIKAVGSISGNADHFSFGPTNPSSSKTSSFSATGYYNDKTKVTQINGSWKGTYLTDKSKWQVGDVIAMAYTGRDYGHIQVYTGYCWMSDFKQNAIQQNHVNPNSVALWRLNEKGIAAVKKQSGANA